MWVICWSITHDGARLRSLQLRLVMPLVVLFVVGTGVIVGFVVWRAYDTADTLSDRELSLRAADLASHVGRRPTARCNSTCRRTCARPMERRPDADSSPCATTTAGSLPPPPMPRLDRGALAGRHRGCRLFPASGVGWPQSDYYGLGLKLDSAVGPVSVWVAQARGTTALVHSMLEEFVFDIAWVIPLLMLLALGIAILAIRNALRPVRELSEVAGSIGPSTTAVRCRRPACPARSSRWSRR